MELRDYQEAAIRATQRALEGGIHRQVWAMATGLGKTVTFAELLRRRGGTALVLAHRDELLDQARQTIQRIWPQAGLGLLHAQADDWQAPVVLASVQSLRQARLLRWEPERFATVVVDEAHHAAAPSYRRILGHLRPELLLGVTATPFRGDRVSLSGVFDRVVFRFGLVEGIRAGWLVDIRAFRVRTDVVLDGVGTAAGDFVADELERTVNTPARNRVVIRTYCQHAAGRRALVFAAGVAHAHALAEMLRAAGVAAAAVDGATPPLERRALVAQLRTGTLSVLVNCQVLTEGFDAPAVQAILLARPTQSLALFTQMVGRGTRPAPGKTELLLFDFVDATARHRVVSAGELIGLRQEIPSGRRLVDGLLAQQQRARATAAFFSHLVPGLQGVDELIEDFAGAGERPEYDWRDAWAEVQQLREDPEARQAVRERFRSTEGAPATPLQVARLRGFGWPEESLASLDRLEGSWAIDRHLTALQGWIEARVRLWARVLGIGPEAAWRALAGQVWQQLPATERQLHLLRRLGVGSPPTGLTRGEAALLLQRLLGPRAAVP